MMRGTFPQGGDLGNRGVPTNMVAEMVIIHINRFFTSKQMSNSKFKKNTHFYAAFVVRNSILKLLGRTAGQKKGQGHDANSKFDFPMSFLVHNRIFM